MNKKIKAALIGIPTLGAVVAGVLLLVTRPLFLVGALVIAGVLYAGYYLGLWILEKSE